MRMTKKIDTSGLLPIKLMRMLDGSVKGVTPDGQQVTWPADYSNKPSRRNKRVMLNCCHWLPVWIDLASIPSDEDLAKQRLIVATTVFERYDFFGASISDVDGWKTANPLHYTRMAHTDAGRINLHVRFEPLTATVTSVEAYDMTTGDYIGALSVDQKEAQA